MIRGGVIDNKLFALRGDDYNTLFYTRTTAIMFITVITTVIIVITFEPG